MGLVLLQEQVTCRSRPSWARVFRPVAVPGKCRAAWSAASAHVPHRALTAVRTMYTECVRVCGTPLRAARAGREARPFCR